MRTTRCVRAKRLSLSHTNNACRNRLLLSIQLEYSILFLLSLWMTLLTQNLFCSISHSVFSIFFSINEICRYRRKNPCEILISIELNISNCSLDLTWSNFVYFCFGETCTANSLSLYSIHINFMNMSTRSYIKSMTLFRYCVFVIFLWLFCLFVLDFMTTTRWLVVFS